jgi:hypothetical protein
MDTPTGFDAGVCALPGIVRLSLDYSKETVRHILDVGFSDRDKTRRHDLVVRNQEDAVMVSPELRHTALRSM